MRWGTNLQHETAGRRGTAWCPEEFDDGREAAPITHPHRESLSLFPRPVPPVRTCAPSSIDADRGRPCRQPLCVRATHDACEAVFAVSTA